MLLPGVLLLFLFLYRALPLPLTTQLSREDEKVIKCISEILTDTLSRPSPIPATKECVGVLREDERVLAMLHHWHLLTELEDLTHQENAKHRLGSGDNHGLWGKGETEQGELKKREQPPQGEEATSEEKEEHTEERGKEEKEMEEYEKTESSKEKVKVFQDEGLLETLEEQKEEEGEEEEEEEIRKKKNSSETWSSKEYFGHIKKKDPRQPRIRKGMVQGDQDGQKRHGMVKRPLRLDEKEEDDSSEEEEPKNHHEGFSKGPHHETSEEGRSGMAKRVAEKATDEETAQFEGEEKGVKISNSKEKLHGSWKPQQEAAEEELESKGKARHGRPHKPVGWDFKKRHWKDEVNLKGRHKASDEDEEEQEASLSKGQELEKLEEIERELRWAAMKLEELKKG